MSAQMHLIKNLFLIRKSLGLARLGRKPKKAAEPSRRMLRELSVTKEQVSGFDVYQVRPKQIERVIVYLHGGGYVVPIAKQHWQLIELLAKQTNAMVYVPRYGLAPGHDVAEALELVERVLEQASSHNLELVLAGDSAGGGLAAATLQHNPKQLVSKLVLISPWLDSEFDHPGMLELSKNDPWLLPDNLTYIAKVWSGTGDHLDPRVSPLRGDLNNFPKTQLFIGNWDIFYFDVREFAQKLLGLGVGLDYQELSNALHVFPLLPTPEGAKARSQIVDFIGSKA